MKIHLNPFLLRTFLSSTVTALISIGRGLLTLAAGSAFSLPAHATVMFWDGNGTLNANWTNTANLYALADGSNPTTAAGANDDVVFVYAGLDNTMYLSQTTGTISVRSLTFNNTGISQIRAGQASRTLNIGEGGITVNSGAGAVLLGRANGTTGAVTLTFKLAADQTWTNHDNDTLDFYYGGAGTGGANLGSAIDTNGKTLSLAGAGNFSLDTPISGAGGLTKGGAGKATIGNSYGATGANTFSGTTTINEGILIVQGSNAITDSGAVSLANTSGASLQLNASETIGSLAGGGTTGGNVNLQANTLTVGDANSTSYGGVISGSNGNLIKTGAGTITLSGASTYSGETTIKSGTINLTSTGTIFNSASLIVGDAGSSGTVLDVTAKSAFSIGSTQTLKGIGTVNIGAGKTVTIDGTHSVGNAGSNGGVGTQTVTGNLNYGGTSMFEWDINTGTATYDKVALSGSLTVDSNAVFKVVSSTGFSDGFWSTTKSWSDIFGSNNLGFDVSKFLYVANGTTVSAPTTYGSFSITGSTLTWTAVPEPTSALAGLLVTAGLLRRRRC